jgi:hypothetical protein
MESKRKDVMRRISQLCRLLLTEEITESEFEERKEKILAEALPGNRAPDPASLGTRLSYRDTQARYGTVSLKVILPVIGLIALFAAVWLYGNFAHKTGRDSAPPPRIALRAPPPKTAAGANVRPSAAAEPTPLNDRETALPRNKESKASEPPRDALKAQITEKSLPAAIGRCAETIVTKVVRRPYENGGPATANFGSAIQYKNGGGQISSEQNAGIDASMPGDRVQICLVALPHNCPRGDNQGAVYHALNMRTGQDWDAPNSERACGGA